MIKFKAFLKPNVALKHDFWLPKALKADFYIAKKFKWQFVTLILHVPMVLEDNKLNLLQFIPFPLLQSLGANTTITPKVDKDLIAVSKHY